MASKTPATAATPELSPVATPTPVKADAVPAPKADPVPAKAAVPAPTPAKPDAAPVDAIKASVASVEKAVAKIVAPVAKAVAPVARAAVPKPANPAPVRTPVAKKKAVVKAAPKIALKPVKKVAAPAVVPATAKAKTIPAPITTAPITTAPVAASKEVNIMEATIKNAAEKAKTMFADANAKSTAAFGDINDFTKGNIEAIVESGKIAAKGIEAMGQDAAEYSRKQFEGMTATIKSLSGVKSPTDFFKLQGDYMRASFDSMVAQTSKNTESMLKLAGEVAQPIQNRVSIAVEKVKIAA